MVSFKSIFLNCVCDINRCYHNRKVMMGDEWMDGWTALSSSPPSPLNRLFLQLIGRVWLSWALRASALPAVSHYTHPKGEGYDTLTTHPPAPKPAQTHTHTHTLFLISLAVHTHRDMRSGLAYIIHAAETDQTPVHTCWTVLLWLSDIRCVCCMTHARWQAAQPKPTEQTHSLTHTHALTEDWIYRRGEESFSEGVNNLKALVARGGEKHLEGTCSFHVVNKRKERQRNTPTLRCGFFNFLFNPLSFCGHEEGVCVSKQTDAKKKKKKTLFRCFWRLCAKVSVRSGARTVPYASDGSNPSPVQHRSGGNERERGEHRRWRRWRRERRGRRSGGQRCCGPV